MNDVCGARDAGVLKPQAGVPEASVPERLAPIFGRKAEEVLQIREESVQIARQENTNYTIKCSPSILSPL